MTIAPEALHFLQRYTWPGNVRELRNVIERAVLLAGGETIEPSHLPEALRETPQAPATAPTLTLSLGITVEEAERALILKSLELAGHNKTRAAAILGISVKTLHNKLVRYQGTEAPRGEASDEASSSRPNLTLPTVLRSVARSDRDGTPRDNDAGLGLGVVDPRTPYPQRAKS